MTPLQWINAAIVALGIPTMVVALIYIGRKLQTLDNLNTSSEKVRHNIKVVSDYLTRHHTKFNPSELQSLSPLHLTPEGDRFIVDIGFSEAFTQNKTDFFQFIDSESPKLKYDVEVAAVKSIYALSDKPYMNFLKVLFYNKPSRNLENTAPTLGVYIRDKYLVEHQEINQ